MNVRRCVMCGVLFNSYGTNKCPECIQELDRQFILVREYIYQNEEADVLEISKETGVDGKIVLEFLRDGRLTLGVESDMLVCENCGKPIKSNRFCEACRGSLEDAFKNRSKKQIITEESKKKQVTRMHLNFDRR
jgi:predicted amidophosphoribosyltransferase